MNDHKWVVRAYYNKDVLPPKYGGQLAFETTHATEHSRDMEIEAAQSRADIGDVHWDVK